MKVIICLILSQLQDQMFNTNTICQMLFGVVKLCSTTVKSLAYIVVSLSKDLVLRSLVMTSSLIFDIIIHFLDIVNMFVLSGHQVYQALLNITQLDAGAGLSLPHL